MIYFLKRVAIWCVIGFVVLSVAWFGFTRPAKLGDAVHGILDGIGNAVDAGAIFLDRATR